MKTIVYAPIPEFDQCTQAVYQTKPVDKGDYIEVGVVVVDLPQEVMRDADIDSARK